MLRPSSKSSSGSRDSYSRCQTSSLALPHQPSRLPRHDQYKISVLAHRFLCALLEFTQLK
ncbi:MAG: hypothetical protein DVB29_04650 [Verrucomicrobia bacterium]|nr:MAG: hypothetical protein DVB29_04650 [Verrucomicrobiota bacterium]